MLKSESISSLAGALAKAQAELRNPGFDSNNPHFRSKYASLAAVRDAVIPILSSHGLSVVQCPIYSDGQAGCETILMHASGEYISNTLTLPVDKANAHGVGSAQTYARRYSLMAFAGVVGDEDDDGNAAVGKDSVSHSKPILKSTITPTTGAWDAIDPAKKEVLHRIGNAIIDFFNAGAAKEAFDFLEQQKLPHEEMVAVWTMLDSAQRRELKKIGKEKQEKANA